MKKKNILTNKEAKDIHERLKKSAKPSEKLKKYVHNVLLRESHILFQYKVGQTRYGYCTYCKNDFPIEIKTMRTYTNNDVEVLQAKHNEKVICPCCGKEVTKRYAGISRKNVFVDVAAFKVDKNGALIVYVYKFEYDYKNDIHIKAPHWHCWQIGYFDIHKYFHQLYGWWNENVYLGDSYTNQLNFTNKQITECAFYRYQYETEGIKCYKLNEVLQKSNLKYSCLMEYMGETSSIDMFKFLKFYCSYPVITEKLMKEGFDSILKERLYGGFSGCFNFRATNVLDFFKLDRIHFKALQEYTFRFNEWDIKAMQFLQNNNIKLNNKNFSFLSRFIDRFDLIKLLLQFMGMQKLMTYVNKQGMLCACRNSYGTYGQQFFENYKDYIEQCKMLEYDLSDKNIVLPMNLFQAHQQLTDLLNQKKAEEEAGAQKEKMKAFKKRLIKLKEKYFFTDGNLLIRPAESYKDLQKEGTTLHHCVYTNYADKYIKGETDILFIRKVSEPDKPFYTLEYKNNNVVQCRTLYNGGTTDEIKAFLKKWKQFLKSNKKKKEAA